MVIDPNNINGTGAGARAKLANTERAQGQKTAHSASSPASAESNTSDSVSLSAQAQSLGKLEAAIASVADVDAEKVEAVRAALQSGQYRIDVEAIAEKILQREF